MKVGFDLDGTLDRPAMLHLAMALLESGHEVYVISGYFGESVAWQGRASKIDKLCRMGLMKRTGIGVAPVVGMLVLEVLTAVSHEDFDRDYRLVDLAMRKGEYIERMGIELMFDDSELYCKMMPNMCGAQMVQVLR